MHRENDLKRKLRRLKKLELGLRFNGAAPDPKLLVWGRFFSDQPEETNCKYPFKGILENDEVRRQAFDDYITTLYYQYYNERGMLDDVANSMVLADLNLPPSASPEEIKARFRALVKKHHPDVGGSHQEMIKVLNLYNKLVK